MDPTVSTAASGAGVKTGQFDDNRRVARRIADAELVFVPALSSSGFTLKEMENGLLLGKFSSNKPIALGTSRQRILPAGSYQMTLRRQNSVWTISATDATGAVRSVTNEVTLHMEKDDPRRLFGKIEPHLMVPPYAMRDDKGKVVPAADEGPANVHGCRCVTIWTTINDPNAGGSATTCWPYERCSCWN